MDIQHKGDYVLTATGSIDFGEISTNIANLIHRQAGKIRLRKGQQNNTQGDFGEKHIERPERLAQLNKAGFSSARDFVETICKNYDEIYSSGTRLMLTGVCNGYTCIIELKPIENEEVYDVITAMIARRKSILNKAAKQKIRLLWQRV